MVQEVSVTSTPASARSLDLLNSLQIPRPWGLERFRAGLESRRGNPLQLIALSLGPQHTGMWIAAPAADIILYDQDADPIRQAWVVGHHVAHMLLGHQRTARHDGTAHALFPHLDLDAVTETLTLSEYSAQDEQEADTFASLLAARVQLSPMAGQLSPGGRMPPPTTPPTWPQTPAARGAGDP
jgi:hypothetical protein